MYLYVSDGAYLSLAGVGGLWEIVLPGPGAATGGQTRTRGGRPGHELGPGLGHADTWTGVQETTLK